MAARWYLHDDLLTYFDKHDTSSSDSHSENVVFDKSTVLEDIASFID